MVQCVQRAGQVHEGRGGTTHRFKQVLHSPTLETSEQLVGVDEGLKVFVAL